MTNILADRQDRLLAGEGLANDPEKNPEAALLGKPGRTQIVGRRSPIPSKKPRLE